jgi:hypothetical protein
MMARSQRSKQKPDTLMQDRPPPTRRNLLATHGRTIQSRQIVDASLVAAPRQRNTDDEKKAIKEGRIPAN